MYVHIGLTLAFLTISQQLVSGDRQQGTVSTRLRRPIVVRVLSLADGKPVPGIEIEFKVVKVWKVDTLHPHVRMHTHTHTHTLLWCKHYSPSSYAHLD